MSKFSAARGGSAANPRVAAEEASLATLSSTSTIQTLSSIGELPSPAVPQPTSNSSTALKEGLTPAAAAKGIITVHSDAAGNEVLTAPSEGLSLTGMCQLTDNSIMQASLASAQAMVTALTTSPFMTLLKEQHREAMEVQRDQVAALHALTAALARSGTLKSIEGGGGGGARRRGSVAGDAGAAAGGDDEAMPSIAELAAEGEILLAPATPRSRATKGVPAELIDPRLPAVHGIPVLRRDALFPIDLSELMVLDYYGASPLVCEQEILAGDRRVHSAVTFTEKTQFTLSPAAMAEIRKAFLRQPVNDEDQVDRDRRPSVVNRCAWLLEPHGVMNLELWNNREKMGVLTPEGAQKPGYFYPGVGLMACWKDIKSPAIIQVAVAHYKPDNSTVEVSSVNNKVEARLFSADNWFITTNMRLRGIKDALDMQCVKPEEIGGALTGLISVKAPNGDVVTVPVITQHVMSSEIKKHSNKEPVAPHRPSSKKSRSKAAAAAKAAVAALDGATTTTTVTKKKRRASVMQDFIEEDDIPAAAAESRKKTTAAPKKKKAPSKPANVLSDDDEDDDSDDEDDDLDDDFSQPTANGDADDDDDDESSSSLASSSSMLSDDDEPEAVATDDEDDVDAGMFDLDDDDAAASTPKKGATSKGKRTPASSTVSAPKRKTTEPVPPPTVLQVSRVDGSSTLAWFDDANPWFNVIKTLAANDFAIIRDRMIELQNAQIAKNNAPTIEMPRMIKWAIKKTDGHKAEANAYWTTIKDQGMAGIVATASNATAPAWKINMLLWLIMSQTTKWSHSLAASAKPRLIKDAAYFRKTAALYANRSTDKFRHADSIVLLRNLPEVSASPIDDIPASGAVLAEKCSSDEKLFIASVTTSPDKFASYLKESMPKMQLAIYLGVLINNCC